jgi:hypothetical protein
LSSLFPLSFQVFHSPIDGGDEFMVSLAFGPSLFRSQHIGELGQHVAFFLHYFLSASLTTPHWFSSAVAISIALKVPSSIARRVSFFGQPYAEVSVTKYQW